MVSSVTTTRNCWQQSKNFVSWSFKSCGRATEVFEGSCFRLKQYETSESTRTKTQRHVPKLSNTAATTSYLTNNSHRNNWNVKENKPLRFNITFSKNETFGSCRDYNFKVCEHENCFFMSSSLFWIKISESFPV